MTRSLIPHRFLALLFVLSGSAVYAACGSEDDSLFHDTPPADDAGNTSSSSGDFGTSGNPPGDGSTIHDNVASLAFDPPAQTLEVDGVNPKTANFKLKATLKDGSVVDVAPESLQFDRPDLATAANGSPVKLTAAGAFAGKGKLHGIYAGIEAVAELTVKVARKTVDNGVPPDAVAALDGANLPADPTLKKLRYPYDKTVFPLGIETPLLMWDDPADNDVYKIHYEQANYTYDRYVALNSPAQIRIDQVIWDRITASNGGDPLKVTVSRYAVAAKKAFTSASVSWTIAPVSLRGAIYYWTASQINNVRQGHISRIRPGTGTKVEPMSTGIPDKPCMGCHAVSADGSTLAASVEAAPTGNPETYAFTNGWSTGRGWASFDLPAGKVRKQTKMAGNNLALTPDGKYTVFGGRMQTDTQLNDGVWEVGSKHMTLAETKTGTIIKQSGLDDIQLANDTRGISMPAFSPDGKKFTVVEFDPGSNPGALRDNVLPESTQILIFGFDQATLKFTKLPTRLPLGNFTPYQPRGIGYPSFTPDTKYVAFHVGNHSTGCFDDRVGNPPTSGGNCDDNTAHRGVLYLEAADGKSAPRRLNALNDPPETRDRDVSVEPTFNPVERGAYSWVVFTSMRDWGNKLTGPAINGKRRLWVAAIDAKPGAGDPSHPAFYLDGQEDSPNMRGFWTLAQCTPTPKPGAGGGACQAGFECCSGFCDKGVCVDVSTIACAGIGGDCTQAADCCNPGAVSCIDGKCRAKIVK